MSLHLSTNLSYPSLATSHECNVSLVSASSWLPCRCTVCLLVDLASVGRENPPPVTNSHLSGISSPFCMIISDNKIYNIRFVFVHRDEVAPYMWKWNMWPINNLSGWFCLANPLCSSASLDGVLSNVAIKYYINSAYVSIEVASHNIQKGICIFSKCLATIRLPKCLD